MGSVICNVLVLHACVYLRASTVLRDLILVEEYNTRAIVLVHAA